MPKILYKLGWVVDHSPIVDSESFIIVFIVVVIVVVKHHQETSIISRHHQQQLMELIPVFMSAFDPPR